MNPLCELCLGLALGALGAALLAWGVRLYRRG